MSGTSMASPHIAGLAAYLLGNSGKQSPAALCAQIQSLATKDVLTKAIKNTKNYLAFNGAGEDSTATPAPEIPKRDEKKNSRWCWAPWCSNAGRP
jgi:subtilisin family serine protease